jgi:hypothetical protein
MRGLRYWKANLPKVTHLISEASSQASEFLTTTIYFPLTKRSSPQWGTFWSCSRSLQTCPLFLDLSNVQLNSCVFFTRLTAPCQYKMYVSPFYIHSAWFRRVLNKGFWNKEWASKWMNGWMGTSQRVGTRTAFISFIRTQWA